MGDMENCSCQKTFCSDLIYTRITLNHHKQRNSFVSRRNIHLFFFFTNINEHCSFSRKDLISNCRLAVERRADSAERHGAHHQHPQREQRAGLAGGAQVGGAALQVRSHTYIHTHTREHTIQTLSLSLSPANTRIYTRTNTRTLLSLPHTDTEKQVRLSALIPRGHPCWS